MKYPIQKSLFSLAVAALIVGCGTEISGDLDDEGDVTPGTADFSRYVAVGDSLTAGYADSALYKHGQKNSFPAILAKQFVAAGGGAFDQPLLMPEKTGSLFFGMTDLDRDDRLVLVPTGDPERPAAPDEITPAISSDIATESIPGLYNNVGVPGAKVFHVALAGYGNPAGLLAMPPSANPYFVRFASTTAASMLTDVIPPSAPSAPTFFTLWIGNNDVLFYALAGGDAIDQNAVDNITPGTYGPDDITDDLVFAGSYPAIVGALKTANNKGVLINIPAVSTIPHFTTVPYDAVPLKGDDLVDLAPLEAGYNGALDALVPGVIDQDEADRRKLSFSKGQNAVVISDETLTPIAGFLPAQLALFDQARQATEDDLILLPVSSKLGEEGLVMGTVWGVTYPLEDGDVLIPSEIDAIETARVAYNAVIKATADADPDLLFFNAAAKLEKLNTTGITYGSGGVSSTFAQGGFFSLDGVHPTARGYAVFANEIIKVIEKGFGANLLPVDPNQYTTVFYQ